MNGRLISFAAALTTVVVFQLLAGCGENLPPENAAGSSATPAGAAGTVATAGSAGANVAGAITSGGGGSGGAATAGTGVGGSLGGQNSGGVAGASAGTGTGGGTAGSGTAGSGTAGGGSEVPATFATVATVLKDQSLPYNCSGGGSCHSSENPFFSLLGPDHNVRSDDELYTFIKGYDTKSCGKLIDTASPAESALVKLLKGPCGATALMPFEKCYVEDEDTGAIAGDCVPPEYVDAIQRWIAAGAPR